MGLIVQKYGGVSVADLDKIKQVAKKIVEEKKHGNDMVVIVSAMAGDTDRLDRMAYALSRNPSLREYDHLLATGEQVSSSLLAIAIQSLGKRAVSFLGHQVPIMTDGYHAKAVIKRVDVGKIRECLDKGYIVVVAGFQGVDRQGNITTLGRGGSDISAVAIAAALKAECCRLYKDVPGVFTADPSVVSNAGRIPAISHEQMLELSSMGAKIVHPRAVELARRFSMPLSITSTFGTKEGTMIIEKRNGFDNTSVVAIIHDKNVAKISIGRIPNEPVWEHKIFEALNREKISVDMIVQSYSRKGLTDIAFAVKRNESDKTVKIVKRLTRNLKDIEVYSNPAIAKVSVIGDAMTIRTDTVARIFKTMARLRIRVYAITASQIKISLAIDEKYTELVVRALHEEFNLNPKRKEKSKRNLCGHTNSRL